MDFRKRVNNLLNKCTRTFGETVTFYPKCGGVFKVNGIFDNDYQVVDVETEQLVSANQPALGVNLNDIKFKLAVNDELELRGLRFRVQEKKEDGQGGATLLLHGLKVSNVEQETRAPKT